MCEERECEDVSIYNTITRCRKQWNHTYSWGQCSWILKILLVRGDVISWATGLLHYYVREFSTLLNVIGDANSCMCKNNLRNPRTLPPTNNDDSIVHHTVFVAYIQKLTISTIVLIFWTQVNLTSFKFLSFVLTSTSAPRDFAMSSRLWSISADITLQTWSK